jgi:putative toxin-antitoxin system antitoxin component (TIGR02293 family)
MPSVIARKTAAKLARKNLLAVSQLDFSFTHIYQVEPMDRIKLIRNGVPARYINVVSDSMGITKDTLFKFLNLPKSTIDKKSVANQMLPIEQGERLIGMAKLVGQVESIVSESGNPDGFNAAKWVANWLEKPSPALGGEKPSAYLDTVSGQEMISDLLSKIQTGAYA